MVKLHKNHKRYEPLLDQANDDGNDGALVSRSAFEGSLRPQDGVDEPDVRGMAFVPDSPFVRAVPMGEGFAYYFVPPDTAKVVGWHEAIHLGDDDGSGVGMAAINEQAFSLVQAMQAQMQQYETEDARHDVPQQEAQGEAVFVHNNGALDVDDGVPHPVEEADSVDVDVHLGEGRNEDEEDAKDERDEAEKDEDDGVIVRSFDEVATTKKGEKQDGETPGPLENSAVDTPKPAPK